jgi:hypothetical protein
MSHSKEDSCKARPAFKAYEPAKLSRKAIGAAESVG